MANAAPKKRVVKKKELEILDPTGQIFKFGSMACRVANGALEVGSWTKTGGFYEDFTFCKMGTIDAIVAVNACLKAEGWVK